MARLSVLLDRLKSPVCCRRKGKFGWMQHVIVLLSFLLFGIGCLLISYMAWVLSTSVTIPRFISGELFLTYVLVASGFLYFFSGLLGWVSALAESYCLLRMFLLMLFLLVLGELGGLFCIYIFNIQVDDILYSGWLQANQATRNFIQNQLNCCGYSGPKEFAYTNDAVDDSCYDNAASTGIYLSGPTFSAQQLKQVGCRSLVLQWLEEHKSAWVATAACLAGVQMLTICVAIYVSQRRRDKITTTKKLSRAATPHRSHSTF